MKVHLVKTNGLILAAYESAVHAEVHARTVTGAHVEHHDMLTRVPATVADDIASDDWDDSPTPVQTDPADITVTRPSTPKAKAKAKRSTRSR